MPMRWCADNRLKNDMVNADNTLMALRCMSTRLCADRLMWDAVIMCDMVNIDQAHCSEVLILIALMHAMRLCADNMLICDMVDDDNTDEIELECYVDCVDALTIS